MKFGFLNKYQVISSISGISLIVIYLLSMKRIIFSSKNHSVIKLFAFLLFLNMYLKRFQT